MEYQNIFQQVGKVLNIHKVKDIRIMYPLQLVGRGEKEVTVRYNKDKEVLDESLKTFYLQAIPYSTLVVDVVKMGKGGPPRRQELSFDDYFSKYHSADKRFYREMITPYIAEQFIQKTKYVRALMGSETCVNLVSPGHFLCHVPGCISLVNLKDFNDLTLAIKHVKDHVTNKSASSSFIKDRSCAVLMKRHNYLKERKSTVAAKDLKAVIEDMEKRKNETGESYAIKTLMVNKLLVEVGQTFKGSVHLAARV